MQGAAKKLIKFTVLFSIYLLLFGIVVVLVLAAFGFYGLSLTILVSVLAHSSSNFRAWLRRQPGFEHRLSRLPGLGGDSPIGMAIAFVIYLLPLSLFGLFLISWAFVSFGTAVVVAIIGIIGLFLIHGWYIRGWRVSSAKNKTIETNSENQIVVQPTKFPFRAVINDLAENKVGIGFTVFAGILPVLYLVGIFVFGAINEPLREIGMLPTYTPTATLALPPISTLTPTSTNTTEPTPTPESTATLIKLVATDTPIPPSPTATTITSLEPTQTSTPVPQQVVNYSVIEEWKPDKNPNGFGADILLEEDLTQEELISFIKYLSGDYDPVLIRIYTSQQAYDQEQSRKYGNEWREGYVIFYVKNLTGEGAYSGLNEIRWMQEIGKFSDLFGQAIKF